MVQLKPESEARIAGARATAELPPERCAADRDTPVTIENTYIPAHATTGSAARSDRMSTGADSGSTPSRRCTCCGRISLHVIVPSIARLIRESPGFEKKGLSHFKLDLLGLCGFGCVYCSSNYGNYLRTRRKEFLALTREQQGRELRPADEPHLTFLWPDAIEKLEEQLRTTPDDWGDGMTIVLSMLTDGFSPDLIRNGTTERALKLLLERTRFRIRILTKNAVVGRGRWLELFARHADRFVVGLSTGTLDDTWARMVEIGTSSPSARLRSLRVLQDAGVPTYGMLCPIFPDVVFDGSLPDLIAAIRPERCETIWAEPFNDRTNWGRVQATYGSATPTHAWFTRAFGTKGSTAWSRYAVDLYRGLRGLAERGGWLSKLVYLLYEANIAPDHALELGDLAGISLQSEPDENGRSKNPAVARLQHTVQWGGTLPMSGGRELDARTGDERSVHAPGAMPALRARRAP